MEQQVLEALRDYLESESYKPRICSDNTIHISKHQIYIATLPLIHEFLSDKGYFAKFVYSGDETFVKLVPLAQKELLKQLFGVLKTQHQYVLLWPECMSIYRHHPKADEGLQFAQGFIMAAGYDCKVSIKPHAYEITLESIKEKPVVKKFNEGTVINFLKDQGFSCHWDQSIERIKVTDEFTHRLQLVLSKCPKPAGCQFVVDSLSPYTIIQIVYPTQEKPTMPIFPKPFSIRAFDFICDINRSYSTSIFVNGDEPRFTLVVESPNQKDVYPFIIGLAHKHGFKIVTAETKPNGVHFVIEKP